MTAGRSRREPQVGEPMVDATPRGVRVRVLEGVERVGRVPRSVRLVVGAVVVDEDRAGVRVLCPEKRDVDARVLLGEHDSRGASLGVIGRVVHVSPPVRRSQCLS
jgi:hypothetical protein